MPYQDASLTVLLAYLAFDQKIIRGNASEWQWAGLPTSLNLKSHA
jgi:hypothetical protein